MKKFTFIVNIDATKPHIEDIVLIDLEAESWKAVVADKKYIGDFTSMVLVQNKLALSFCMYGHSFNPDCFSPQDLYEALSSISEWRFKVNGDVPDNPTYHDPLPDGAID